MMKPSDPLFHLPQSILSQLLPSCPLFMDSLMDESGEFLHPTTGEIIPYGDLLREANQNGFSDPLAYLEHLDMPHIEMDIEDEEEEKENSPEDKERKRRIQEMREENEKESVLSLIYSRSCLLCPSFSPSSRVVFTQCGHWSCLSCGDKHSRGRDSLLCPFCNITTGLIRLFEDTVDWTTPSSSSENEEYSAVIHPSTGRLIPFYELRQEATHRGFTDPFDYMEYIDSNEIERMEQDDDPHIHNDHQRKDDNSNESLLYSRECRICFSSNPLCRAVSSLCGHWSCLPCALTLSKGESSLTCPFCRAITPYVPMIEQPICQ